MSLAVAFLIASETLERWFGGVFFGIPLAVTTLTALGLGAGPGAVTASVSGLGMLYFRMPPTGSFALADDRDIARLIAYLLGATAVVGAGAALERTRRRLQTAKAEAERAVDELRSEAERLSTLAENSPEVIARFDRHLRHTFINGAGTRVYGRSREEILGKTNAELGMPVDKVAYWKEHFEQVFASGRQRTVDFDFDSPTLGHRYFSSLFVPEFDVRGEVASILAITRDVTAVKSVEEELREQDRRKNQFLGMLSHELRNPLAPIRNSLYVLDRAEPGGPQARRAREVIGRQVLHLTRLVDDLLDVTRISRGKIRLQRERVELCQLVRRTAEDHRATFDASELRLEVEACPAGLVATGDPTRLAQVIGNLLTNAAKFTPRGGRVSLALEAEGGTAVIRVRDTGAGMGRELLERLFQPFVQADVTLDRSQGGLGLGLALVKGLVELHGGTVGARSDGPGKGSEFLVRLPLEAVVEPERQPAPTPAAGTCPPAVRVLVIEDNTDAAESLREALALGGHVVELANTGPDGLEKARAFRPDVVLCDIGLPGMNGYDVARAMRADAALAGIALIALSGYAQPEDRERSRAAGFERHLAKPPDLDLLERVLREACPPATGR